MDKTIKLIKDTTIYLPDRIIPSGWLLINDTSINDFGAGKYPASSNLSDIQVIDGKDLNLIPGFIDIHTHGALNIEAMDHSVDGLFTMAHFYATHGVTSFLPTTWSAPINTLLPVLETIKTVSGRTPNGASILGAHLEGPFINSEVAGAQNPDFIFAPTPENFEKLLKTNIIRLITLAPEIQNAEWLIETCRKHHITVSAGHTKADYKTMVKGFDLGITQTTHTFNAMVGLHHRQPGGVGAALSDDRISCELIADTIHVHPAALKIAYRAKTNRNILLVTDTIRAAGLPDGEYSIDNRVIHLQNGIARIPEGNLAGSTLTMDKNVKNFMNATGESLAAILPTATLNPARAIGVADRKGSIEKQKDADLVLMDHDGKVVLTIVEGSCIKP